MNSDIAFNLAAISAALFFLLFTIALILLPLMGNSIRRTLQAILEEVKNLNSSISQLRKDLAPPG